MESSFLLFYLKFPVTSAATLLLDSYRHLHRKSAKAEKEIVSVERAELKKLMKAVADRIKNMIKQGTATVTVNSIKEEYQQLIDPVEP